MKPLLQPVCFFVLLALVACSESEPSQRSTEPSFAHVVDQALREGADATLNAGFAQFLGLSVDGPVALKRIKFEEDGATNTLDVLVNNPETVIVTQRRGSLSTFHLCDRSGNLKRAVVNDGAIAVGGITNLTVEAAGFPFEEIKRRWIQETPH